MVSSTLKFCVPLLLAMAVLAGCGKQGDENAGAPPAPVSSAAAPSPAMPSSSEQGLPPPASSSPAYPQSSPAPASTTH